MPDLTIPTINATWEGFPLNAPTAGSRDYYLKTLNNVNKDVWLRLFMGDCFIALPMVLDGSGGTFVKGIGNVNGVIEIVKIWAVVGTELHNCTAASLNYTDGGVTIDLTESITGATLTNAPVGSLIYAGPVASALQYISSASVGMKQVTNTVPMQPMILIQKIGTGSIIQFKYTTTDTPTAGTIVFYIIYKTLSANAFISPVQ